VEFTWESIKLADNTDYPAFGVTLNGAQIVQEAQFIRAATAALYGRGNRKVQVSFNATKTFTTVREAQEFVLNHYNLLSDEGTLTIRIGAGDESPYDVYLADAVLAGISFPEYIGCMVTVQYQFAAPAISGIDYTPPAEGTEVDIRRGTVVIGSGAETITVTGLGLPSVPAQVLLSVRKPAAGGMNITAHLVGDPTTDGFTAHLSGITPGTGYKLDYEALL